MKQKQMADGRWQMAGFCLILAVLSVTNGIASDLLTGYPFTSGELNITHVKLNNAVNNATIQTGFYTDKSAVTTTESGDLVLIYSSANAGFRKISALNLFISNLGIITNQTQDLTPATGDFLLTYDISAASLKKASLMDLVFTNDFLINGRTNWATPSRTTTSLLAYDTATKEYSKLTRSNLFYEFFLFNTFTNAPLYTTPTNNDMILVWDGTNGSNKQVPIISIFTNTVTLAAPTNAATLFINETGQVKQVTISNVLYQASVGGLFLTTNTTFTSTNFPLSRIGTAATNAINMAHSLGVKPKFVRAALECTTADLDFSVGDEVNADAVEVLSGAFAYQAIGCGANETNVFAHIYYTDGNYYLRANYSGSTTPITKARWRLKLYARP